MHDFIYQIKFSKVFVVAYTPSCFSQSSAFQTDLTALCCLEMLLRQNYSYYIKNISGTVSGLLRQTRSRSK